MRIGLVALALLLPAPSLAQQSAPEIQFQSVPGFFKLPDDIHFGEVPGVAVNSRGHIFVFSRGNSASGPAFGPTAAHLLEFDRNGNFVREIGKGLYGWSFAHNVRIDRSDNIWVVDKGSNMVIKFNPAGRVEWVFGRREESTHEPEPMERSNPPLPHVDGQFRQPTDVAWDSRGNIYITDGYINSRVAKYDANGDWVESWGEFGTGPKQFSTPHAIAVDHQDNVYVGDRGNRRVQVFDTNGNLLRTFSVDVPPTGGKAVIGRTPPAGSMQGVGAPNSLCIPPGPNPNRVLFLGETTWPGRIFKLTLDGQVLGVIGRAGRNLGQFSGAHQIACPSENEIYIAETSNWRVQKLILQPPARTTGDGR